jgi:hypothetical protein
LRFSLSYRDVEDLLAERAMQQRLSASSDQMLKIQAFLNGRRKEGGRRQEKKKTTTKRLCLEVRRSSADLAAHGRTRTITESAKPKFAGSKPGTPVHHRPLLDKILLSSEPTGPKPIAEGLPNTPSILRDPGFSLHQFYSSRREPQKALGRRKKIRQIWKHSRN